MNSTGIPSSEEGVGAWGLSQGWHAVSLQRTTSVSRFIQQTLPPSLKGLEPYA